MSEQQSTPRQLAGMGKELAILSIPPAAVTFVMALAALAAMTVAFPEETLVGVGVATLTAFVAITVLTIRWSKYLSNL